MITLCMLIDKYGSAYKARIVYINTSLSLIKKKFMILISESALPRVPNEEKSAQFVNVSNYT